MIPVCFFLSVRMKAICCSLLLFFFPFVLSCDAQYKVDAMTIRKWIEIKVELNSIRLSFRSDGKRQRSECVASHANHMSSLFILLNLAPHLKARTSSTALHANTTKTIRTHDELCRYFNIIFHCKSIANYIIDQVGWLLPVVVSLHCFQLIASGALLLFSSFGTADTGSTQNVAISIDKWHINFVCCEHF